MCVGVFLLQAGVHSKYTTSLNNDLYSAVSNAQSLSQALPQVKPIKLYD